jgi:hypothetical protein
MSELNINSEEFAEGWISDLHAVSAGEKKCTVLVNSGLGFDLNFVFQYPNELPVPLQPGIDKIDLSPTEAQAMIDNCSQEELSQIARRCS